LDTVDTENTLDALHVAERAAVDLDLHLDVDLET
tara:strand:- start:328 stop:429 length:102 start_codon:yes stop_codon:yes gene_type:complete